MSKEKKKEKNERIEKSFQNMSEVFFSKLTHNSLCQNFLNWAETHRKAMFFITMSFLVLVFVFSIFYHPKSISLNDEFAKIDSVDNMPFVPNSSSGVSLKDLFELMDIQDRISELKKKKQLTAEDTLMVNELYARLTALAVPPQTTKEDDSLKMKELLDELRLNKKNQQLTAEDTLMVNELYKKLKNLKNGK